MIPDVALIVANAAASIATYKPYVSSVVKNCCNAGESTSQYLGHGSLMCAMTSSESSIRTTENTDVGFVPPSATTAAFDVRTVCLKYP